MNTSSLAGRSLGADMFLPPICVRRHAVWRKLKMTHLIRAERDSDHYGRGAGRM